VSAENDLLSGRSTHQNGGPFSNHIRRSIEPAGATGCKLLSGKPARKRTRAILMRSSVAYTFKKAVFPAQNSIAPCCLLRHVMSVRVYPPNRKGAGLPGGRFVKAEELTTQTCNPTCQVPRFLRAFGHHRPKLQGHKTASCWFPAYHEGGSRSIPKTP